MAAPITGGLLTFCRISVFRRTSGVLCVRLKSGKPAYQDLRPEHEKKYEPDTVMRQPGPWKNYCTNDFWNKNKRRVDKDVFEPDKVDEILKRMDMSQFETKDDMPAEDMPNPFVERQKKCIICQYNVKLDYKNTQLLSQFVSPYTGRVYGHHITGLCLPMQRTIGGLILTSRRLGFMPLFYKDMEYLEDPQLFNPFGKKFRIPQKKKSEPKEKQ